MYINGRYVWRASEVVLGSIAMVVVLAAISLALGITFVMPMKYKVPSTSNASRGARTAEDDERDRCRCNMQKCVLKRHFPGIPAVPPQNSANVITKFPYMVSLNAPAYVDGLEFRRFACSGVVLTETWILTGGGCVTRDNGWSMLKIRAGSDFWSDGGSLHAIVSFSRSPKRNGPIALKITPRLEFCEAIQPIELPSAPVRNFSEAYSFGWHKAVSDDINFRFKYKAMDVEKWSTHQEHCKNPPCVKGQVGREPYCDDVTSGRPLVVNNNTLVGMHTGQGCEHVNVEYKGLGQNYYFTNIQTRRIMEWLRLVIEDNVDNLEPVPSLGSIKKDRHDDAFITVYKDLEAGKSEICEVVGNSTKCRDVFDDVPGEESLTQVKPNETIMLDDYGNSSVIEVVKKTPGIGVTNATGFASKTAKRSIVESEFVLREPAWNGVRDMYLISTASQLSQSLLKRMKVAEKYGKGYANFML